MSEGVVFIDPIDKLHPVAAVMAEDLFNELRKGDEKAIDIMLDHFNGKGPGYDAFAKIIRHVAEEERDEAYMELRRAVANRMNYEAEALGRI